MNNFQGGSLGGIGDVAFVFYYIVDLYLCRNRLEKAEACVNRDGHRTIGVEQDIPIRYARGTLDAFCPGSYKAMSQCHVSRAGAR